MDIYVVVGVTLVVVIGGLVAARLWWNLASKGAPYEDEAGGRGRGRRDGEEPAQVISWPPTTDGDGAGTTGAKGTPG